MQLTERSRGTFQGPPQQLGTSWMMRPTMRQLACGCVTKESGAWLRALPVSSLGLRMDDDTVRIAVGLRLGTSVCGPHQCQHCSAMVDEFGRHALSCRRSEGRHQRHAALNDIMKRALASAHVPSRLEPTGLVRSDGKRPDGVTLTPWKFRTFSSVGCDLPGHFCPILQSTCNSGARKGGSRSRGEERGEIPLPAAKSLVYTTLHRDHGRNWSKVLVIAEGCGVAHSK